MATLILNGTGFINEVKQLKNGKFAIELALESYSIKQDDGSYKPKMFYITAYTKDNSIIPKDTKNVLMDIAVSGLTYSINEKNGKTYVNHSANLVSASKFVPPSQANA